MKSQLSISKISDNQTRDILLQCYGEEVYEIEHLGSYMNATVLALTNAGRRVLKIYGRGCRDKNKIAYNHELLTFLNERRFPAVKLLRSRSGETLVKWNDKICALFDFAEGDIYEPGNLKQLISAGETLGAYHRTVADFKTSITVKWQAMKTLVIDGLKEELKVIRAAVEANPDGPVDARYIDDLRGKLDQTEKSLSLLDCGDLPTTTIHGDWRAQNIKFNGDEVSCVLDFDFARPAERLFDISYALVFFPAVVSLFPPNTKEIAAILHAYNEVNPLADVELQMLPDFLHLSFLRGMTLWLRIYYLDEIRGNVSKWIRNYLPLWGMLNKVL